MKCASADQAGDERPAQSVDVFHRGAFVLVQPATSGHRAGMDAMMLAAAVPSAFAGRVADLGAGAGAAGLAVAARCPEATVVLVENAPEMAYFAARTLAHAENADVAGRASLIEADVTLAGRARVAAGLADRDFDFALMNPPFNTAAHRPSPDALKRRAHVMEPDLFEPWIKTAAAIVRPRGGLALIARPSSLRPILDAIHGRFGDAMIMPIHARLDQPAIRFVLRAIRGARGELRLVPPLILHETGTNRFLPHADAINNGRASLFGD
jgi:tRNA1(Val) A37 N6-methylase TrmN6